MRRIPVSDLAWRHIAFLEMADVDRPLLGLWVGDYYFTIQYPTGTGRWQPGAEIRPEMLAFEHFAADHLRLYELHERLDDDFFYVGSAYPGLPWMEAIMGCRVYAETTSAWAAPFLTDYAQLDALRRPVAESPWFQALLRWTVDLVAWAAGRFPVNAPLLRGPADIAAAVRGADRFVMDFFDHPDEVRELLRLCTGARKEVMAAILAVAQPFHGGYAAGGYPSRLWTPGRTCLYNQEDAAAVLSPRIFRRELMPLEASIAAPAQTPYIHLHSACTYPVDILLEDPSYPVLQINYDHAGAGPRLPELMPVLKKVAGRKPLILWGKFTLTELELLVATLGRRGLSIQPIAATEAEAVALREAFYRMWG